MRWNPARPYLLRATSVGGRAAVARLSGSLSSGSGFDPESYSTSEYYVERLSRECPTRELNYSHQRWAVHRAPGRHFRHLSHIGKSAPLQRLAYPDLLCVGAVSSLITYYNTVVVEAANQTMLPGETALSLASLPPLPFTLSTLALGLLTTFRTNASYNRYVDARIQWGNIINASRDLSRRAAMWLPDAGTGGEPGNEASGRQRRRVQALIKAFPIALNFHLTPDGGRHRLRAAALEGTEAGRAAVRDEMARELGERAWPAGSEDGSGDGGSGNAVDDDFAKVRAADHAPLICLRLMADALARIPPREAGDVGAERALRQIELDRTVGRLNDAMGACERLLRTPIPQSYTRHTSRFLSLWCNLVPLALYPTCGLATVPASIFIAYALLGIEDIGVQIEEAFDILPLGQYCDAIVASVDAIEGHD